VNVDWDAWNVGDRPKYPHEKVVQWVFRNYPQESRASSQALDMGCGSGVHTVFLADEGFAVTAVDVSAVGIANTRRRLADRSLHADLMVSPAESVLLTPRSFALAVCVGVLECLSLPAATETVEKVAAALRDGGKALFLFPSDRDFRMKADNPLQLRGSTRDDVDVMFGQRFARVWVDRYITTYEGGAIEQNDWLVTTEAGAPGGRMTS